MMKRRRGITLIEMIVAVAILAVLMSLVIIGLKAVFVGGAQKQTQLLLSQCQGMLQELRTVEPSLSSLDSFYSGATNLSLDDAALRTSQVIQRLCVMPGVKSAWSKLAPDQMYTPSGASAPIPLDAWGKPIIFVPAGGLTVDGSFLRDTNAVHRPFFASGGPDGKISTTGDNIYSYSN